ncbi:Methylated-DNA--protein-cysteine methyltransferase, constitutive [bacterium HR23]|nr:Methylated-DNA--protein-cysteine methyltransferase, constitutive [bacterium HR23]
MTARLSCREAQRRFDLGGSPEEDADLGAHLAQCTSCRRSFTQRARVRRILASLAPALGAPDLVSRIQEALKRWAKATPAPPAPQVSYAGLDSPLGKVLVAFWRGSLVRLALETPEDAFVETVRRQIGVRPRSRPLPLRLRRALEDGLARWGKGAEHRSFTLPLVFLGVSPFQARVLEVVSTIPWGEVRTYAWVAREAGHPSALRAVAQALARNPVPLFVPCHRVVASDGSLGGYALGREMKAKLLSAEGIPVEALPLLVGRFYGCTSTRIVCWPTCRHARRVSPPRLRLFSSVQEARAAGFRPCTVCRP